MKGQSCREEMMSRAADQQLQPVEAYRLYVLVAIHLDLEYMESCSWFLVIENVTYCPTYCPI